MITGRAIFHKALCSAGISAAFSLLAFTARFGLSEPIAVVDMRNENILQMLMCGLMASLVPALVASRKHGKSVRRAGTLAAAVSFVLVLCLGVPSFIVASRRSEIHSVAAALSLKAAYGGLIGAVAASASLWLVARRRIA